jgi:hypothetical protein
MGAITLGRMGRQGKRPVLSPAFFVQGRRELVVSEETAEGHSRFRRKLQKGPSDDFARALIELPKDSTCSASSRIVLSKFADRRCNFRSVFGHDASYQIGDSLRSCACAVSACWRVERWAYP